MYFYKKITPTYWVAHHKIIGLRREHAVQTGPAQIAPPNDQGQHKHKKEDAGLANKYRKQQGPCDHSSTMFLNRSIGKAM